MEKFTPPKCYQGCGQQPEQLVNMAAALTFRRCLKYRHMRRHGEPEHSRSLFKTHPREWRHHFLKITCRGLIPIVIRPATRSRTNGPEQPSLRHSMLRHQSHADPCQRGRRCFPTSPEIGLSNDAKPNSANNLSMPGWDQPKGLDIFQFIHGAS
jgi:hypothetical protein